MIIFFFSWTAYSANAIKTTWTCARARSLRLPTWDLDGRYRFHFSICFSRWALASICCFIAHSVASLRSRFERTAVAFRGQFVRFCFTHTAALYDNKSCLSTISRVSLKYIHKCCAQSNYYCAVHTDSRKKYMVAIQQRKNPVIPKH